MVSQTPILKFGTSNNFIGVDIMKTNIETIYSNINHSIGLHEVTLTAMENHIETLKPGTKRQSLRTDITKLSHEIKGLEHALTFFLD